MSALAAKAKGAAVAVARADGSFELVDGAARWTSVARVAGRRDAAASSLAWVAGRCYGATASGILFEVDFAAGRIAAETDALGGAVWHLVADARAPARLNACCDDGSIRVFECDEGGTLAYAGALRVATGARCLCGAWAELGASRALFAGCDDGTLRRLDARTGRSSLRLTVDGDAPRVWSVATLCDATSCTVASGDSNGAVCLWDGVVGALLRRFARHDADVLSVCVAGGCVFASGADSKVVCLERDRRGDWAFAAAHRPHVLDVRALCVSEDRDGRPVLLSGALDAKLCAYAASNGRSFAERRPARLWPFPGTPCVHACDAPRLAACCHGDRADVWRLAGAGGDAPPAPVLALRVTAPGPHNLAFACLFALAEARVLLVLGDGATRTRCLRVEDDGGALTTDRVAGARRLPPALAAAASGGVLVLACAGRIVAYDVTPDELTPRASIACACPAPALLALRDGRVACAARGGRVFVAALDAKAAAPAPRGPARAAALAFLADGLLAAATLDPARQLCVLDAAAEILESEPRAVVARRQAVLDAAATALTKRKDAPVGLVAGPQDRLLVHSHAYVLLVDTNAAAPPAPPPTPASKHRRRSRSTTAFVANDDAALSGPAWTFSTLYSPLLAAAWLGDEILVAENPWLAIARQQTSVGAVARRKYGA